jgi:hypothetical protein
MNKTILITEEIEITKDIINNNLYTIKCKNNIALIRSIKYILKNTTHINNKLIIKANKIINIEEFIKEEKSIIIENICLNIIFYLSNQIKYLITKERKCFYKIDPKNIFIIDNKIVYISTEDLKDLHNDINNNDINNDINNNDINNNDINNDINNDTNNNDTNNDNNNLEIYTIIDKKNGYFSPELLKITEIPFKINYKTIYYSLGLLILDIFHIQLDDIKESKLYYFLIRCLNDNIKERFLLYL